MNKQNIFVVSLVLFVLILSVGYATFTQSLTVNWTANANGNFDVGFDSTVITEDNNFHANIENSEKKSSSIISEDGKTITITVPQLDQPGSYVRIKSVIKNNGTIPVQLKELVAVDPNNENGTSEDINAFLKKDTNIKISFEEYDDTQKFTEMKNRVLNQNDTQEIFIKIEWDPNSTAQSTEVRFNLRFTYQQITV